MLGTSPRPLVLLASLVIIGCASHQQGGVAATSPPREPDSSATSVKDPFDLLRSRSPGLMVTRAADGSVAVQLLQPPTSVNSSAEPLYLVDDVPFKPGPGGALNGISPYDIVSIQALRRPEDIGIYGMRGANGVIVIKTKKPGT
jgi:TonB-dependent SusC/RagA subfamily outer membrane receptor